MQLTDLLWYHAFVRFETKGWWWSIEKNGQGVTVQRSKQPQFVKDHYRRGKRVTPVTVGIQHFLNLPKTWQKSCLFSALLWKIFNKKTLNMQECLSWGLPLSGLRNDLAKCQSKVIWSLFAWNNCWLHKIVDSWSPGFIELPHSVHLVILYFTIAMTPWLLGVDIRISQSLCLVVIQSASLPAYWECRSFYSFCQAACFKHQKIFQWWKPEAVGLFVTWPVFYTTRISSAAITIFSPTTASSSPPESSTRSTEREKFAPSALEGIFRTKIRQGTIFQPFPINRTIIWGVLLGKGLKWLHRLVGGSIGPI